MYFALILKNALRNRRRSLLTICSMAGSFCMLGVLMAMYHLFFFAPPSRDSALRLIVRNRISITNFLPLYYASRIRAVSGVREVMIDQWFGGEYKDSRDFNNYFPRFAVDASKLFTIYPEFDLPEDQKRAFISERTACIVGRALADRLGFRVGDRLTLKGDIFPVTLDFKIRGIYDGPHEREQMFFHFDYLNEAMFKGGQNFVSMFVILAESPGSIPEISRTIDDMFRNSTARTKTESEKAFMLTFLSYLGNIKVFLLAVCVSLALTVLMVSANTMAMSVRERIREVGILKTLGFPNSGILELILGESVAISVAGASLGLFLAALTVAGIRRLPVMFMDLQPLAISIPVAALGLALAGLVGLLSSFVPAWAAARRPILECMRLAD